MMDDDDDIDLTQLSAKEDEEEVVLVAATEEDALAALATAALAVAIEEEAATEYPVDKEVSSTPSRKRDHQSQVFHDEIGVTMMLQALEQNSVTMNTIRNEYFNDELTWDEYVTKMNDMYNWEGYTFQDTHTLLEATIMKLGNNPGTLE